MVSFKTLARAISPFAGKSKNSNKDSKDVQWDLDNINFENTLREFYTVYNLERVDNIDEILHQYKGEEQQLLEQLCRRYGLSYNQMQNFFRFDSPPESENKQRRDSKDEQKDIDPISCYRWDTSQVDIAKVLRAIYQDHNPTKIPKVSKLDEKSNDDIVLLLQHLCKRHKLSHHDIQRYLDASREQKKLVAVNTSGQRYERKSILQDAPPPTAIPSRHRSPSVAPSDTSEITTSLLSGTSRKSSITRTSITHTLPHSPALPTVPAPPVLPDDLPPLPTVPPPPPPQTATEPPPPPPPLSRQPSISSANSHLSKPPIVPRPSLTNDAPANSKVPFTAPVPGSSGSVRSENNAETAERNHREHLSRKMRPVLEGGIRFSMGPVLKEFEGKAPPRIRTESDELQIQTNTSASRLSQVVNQATTDCSSVGGSTTEASIHNSDYISSNQTKEEIDTLGSEIETASQNSLSNYELKYQQLQEQFNKELIGLKTELDSSQQQLRAIHQENSTLLEELNTARLNAKLENSASARKPEVTDTVQVQKLREELALLTDMLREKQENFNQIKDEHERTALKLRRSESTLQREIRSRQDAEIDRRDLLQLIDIMSASPVSVTGVLDAYLSKLGEMTECAAVRRGYDSEGRKMLVSERIALALSAKRKKEHGDSALATDNSCAEEKASTNESVEKNLLSGAVPFISKQEQQLYRSMKESLNRNTPRESSKKKHTVANDLRKETPNQSVFPSSTGSINDQYDLAKQVLLHQTSHEKFSQQLAERNLQTQQNNTEKAISDSMMKDKQLLLNTGRLELADADGSSRFQEDSVQTNEKKRVSKQDLVNVDDWVTCFDPRSQRHYYYSPSLKKSTWKKPQSTKQKQTENFSRSSSPNVDLRKAKGFLDHHQELLQQMSRDGSNTPQDSISVITSDSYRRSPKYPNPERRAASASKRNLSPTFSMRSTSPNTAIGRRTIPQGTRSLPSSPHVVRPTASSSNKDRNNNRSNSSGRSNWSTAVDPKSQRRYWYNRATKVSTWRKPAELII